jgi:AraC family transcriptional activator of pobA
MNPKNLLHFKTISQLHKFRRLPGPENPLVSLIDLEKAGQWPISEPAGLVCDFYSISLKQLHDASLQYGQFNYDFDQGTMFFMSPGQVWALKSDNPQNILQTGWVLLFHPDLLWKTPLAGKINKYEYFSYSAKEALFLSEKEESIITGLVQDIIQEVGLNADRFSQELIVGRLDVLLTYAERFYSRQFLTRKKISFQLLDQMESLLNDQLNKDEHTLIKPLSVNSIAERLNVSPGYLSSMLKFYTGNTAQQHVNNKMVNISKERLSLTASTVSEIAFQLGFQHTQSFCKFFKSNTSQSPMQFRKSLLINLGQNKDAN